MMGGDFHKDVRDEVSGYEGLVKCRSAVKLPSQLIPCMWKKLKGCPPNIFHYKQGALSLAQIEFFTPGLSLARVLEDKGVAPKMERASSRLLCLERIHSKTHTLSWRPWPSLPYNMGITCTKAGPPLQQEKCYPRSYGCLLLTLAVDGWRQQDWVSIHQFLNESNFLYPTIKSYGRIITVGEAHALVCRRSQIQLWHL